MAENPGFYCLALIPWTRMNVIIFFALLGAAVAFPTDDEEEDILGGYTCEPHTVPYQVLLRMDSEPICGGALINLQWVVTAAHCYGFSFEIVLGVHNIHDMEGMEEIIESAKVVVHPKFNFFTNNNDIMLIKLKTPATTNHNVAFVSLPDSCPDVGTSCLISGWGKISENSTDFTDELQCLESPVLPDNICKDSHPGKVSNNMICLGYLEGGKDSCQGDSGSPAVCNGELQGIVSWGDGCAQKGKPGVYTKVCNYVDWIEEIIAKN